MKPRKGGVNIKKSYNLYLVLSLSFIVIILISFLVGIKSEIIFGYSVATLIFSVIDLIIVIQEGRDKVSSLKSEDINNTLDEYAGTVNSVLEGVIDNIQDGKRELVNTRKKFYEKLLAQQPVFNLKKKNVKKAMKPVENINELSRDLNFPDGFFDKITKDLKTFNPLKKEIRASKLAWLFSMIGLILVLVSPFIPEEAFVFIFGKNFSSAGTYLVLLSLSIIFLTSYFRNKYEEQVIELQKLQYSSILGQFEKIKFQMEFSMKDLNEALNASGQEFEEVIELIASSVEKVRETKEEKKLGLK
ncbi:hypothetical protein [Paenibacillus woosongensis]|uniref:Uncharacterized protein n=1 Tax=Paenibacillus woosongensis TaxID=307580 RepID=A0A7X3CPR7_9BACL|nr:hypothetical protein [Paenibacillus woosongensis]MUG46305.1 hypothetical protein [Paenibacillus woosongensis]